MARTDDCIIIGAGHNGLVCAATLARAGRSVKVLEAGDRPGGAAVTHEFAPGFRCSSVAHLLHLLPSKLGSELQLERHGLSTSGPIRSFSLKRDQAPLPMDAAGLRAAGHIDAAAMEKWSVRMPRFAAVLRSALETVPPRLGTGATRDKLALLRLGWQIRRLGRQDMRELLRIGGMNVYDLLEEYFSAEGLKGALALDATLGTNFGPRSPGTVLTLLYRLALEGGAGGVSVVRGGMGALSQALASSAAAAGAQIRMNAPVAGILVEADRVAGVRLEDGEEIRARTVISSADPKTTFLGLLGARHLDTGFVRSVRHLRSRGLAAKLHLALDAAPEFTGLDAAGLGARLLVAPSMDHVERAYNHSKYGEFSEEPVIEITLPTVHDQTLAPPGRHVLSAVVQCAPHELKRGWDEPARRTFQDRIIDTIEQVAPGLRGRIIASQLLTPADIERKFRISGGHWHHGELAFDQFFMVRPVPGAAQYSTPVEGLYLCGSGSHPGGGVTGLPGRNAARRVIEETV